MGRVEEGQGPSHACSITRPEGPDIQHELIAAGPIDRRAIGCDTIYLELRDRLSWLALALALELCLLPVPGLADGVCLLELLVEGSGMMHQCQPRTANACADFPSPTSPSRHTLHRSEGC